VTGRQTYSEFKKGISILSLEGTLRERLDAEPLHPSDAEIKAAMDQALDRAYAVAWALRGPVAQRAALRARLGWIAVSAEDDTPHRPVNMPAPPFEQYEVRVRTPRRPVTSGELALSTRFFVACAEDISRAGVPIPPRQAPNDPVPNIPGDHSVLLFLHGHSSGAEEALDLIPPLLEQGLRRGKKYAVISFDLPNNGYSETFDHTLIAAANATNFPFLPSDNTPISTPILDFIEDFVVAFVDAVENLTILNGLPRIKGRIAAVIGGSLGGNLGLRLGRRKESPPWLRAIVSWSPASVWKAMVKHDPRREASRDTLVEFQKPEIENSRRNYFFRVYEEIRSFGVITITKPQPTYWYGASFLNAGFYVQLSRVARREIYNAFYRQWHWRVACEQLIYSHFENEVYGDNSTPVRYTLNTVRTLLVAGEEDNYPNVGIYDGTRKLGESMTRTPGRLLLIRKTGHSIHTERPQYFASEIVKFLQEGLASVPVPGTREDPHVFNADFYLRHYADLRAAFGNDVTAARDHWLNHGLNEGRRGSREFDVQFYLNQYSDLRSAFGGNFTAAVDHWLNYGLNEGRRGSREFDVQFYLNCYGDLRNAFGKNYAAAIYHWLNQGLPNEGRRGSREFDVKYYLDHYGDLRSAFGANYMAAIDHWLNQGLPNEGRAGAREVDVSYYLGNYNDLRSEFGANYQNAIDHWVTQGLPNEGRRASLEFDVQYYLATYHDLQAAFGKNYSAAFDHWVNTGIAEGRKGVP